MGGTRAAYDCIAIKLEPRSFDMSCTRPQFLPVKRDYSIFTGGLRPNRVVEQLDVLFGECGRTKSCGIAYRCTRRSECSE